MHIVSRQIGDVDFHIIQECSMISYTLNVSGMSLTRAGCSLKASPLSWCKENAPTAQVVGRRGMVAWRSIRPSGLVAQKQNGERMILNNTIIITIYHII